MCLVTEQKVAKIATEDITCYKVVKLRYGRIFSAIQEFEYEMGKLYRTHIMIEKECNPRIHLYPTQLSYDTYHMKRDVTWISEGFHAY